MKILGALLLLMLTVSYADAGGAHRSGGRVHGGGHHHGGSHGHGRVIIGVGPWWGPGWWGGWPYYGYYPYYSYSPSYYPPAPAVAEPTYIHRPLDAGSTSETSWWYYCQSMADYYPTVQSCPEPWLKVAPRTQ